MSNILEQIKTYKRGEVSNAKSQITPAELDDMAEATNPPCGFISAIERAKTDKRYALIAEIKKASPSKGLIREDFSPKALAGAYERGGATCLSVLTDGPSFQGDESYLRTARRKVDLPILRKDFMIDVYQVAQTRAMGADCILLIMAILSDGRAAELEQAAHSWGLDVLVEVHDEQELERALKLKTKLIGINNRNLKTFVTSLETTERLATGVPQDRILVSESGISTIEDIERLAPHNINTFLVGESLMRQSDVENATRTLLGLDKTITPASA